MGPPPEPDRPVCGAAGVGAAGAGEAGVPSAGTRAIAMYTRPVTGSARAAAGNEIRTRTPLRGGAPARTPAVEITIARASTTTVRRFI